MSERNQNRKKTMQQKYLIVALLLFVIVYHVPPTSGAVTKILGTTYNPLNGDGIDRRFAFFNRPTGMAYTPSGELIIADSDACSIRRVFTNGTIVSLSSRLPSNMYGASEDSYAWNMTICTSHITTDSNGDVYFTDSGAVRKLDLNTMKVTTMAGIVGSAGGGMTQGGPALTTQINEPYGLAVAPNGTIYVANHQGNILRIENGQMDVIAGLGLNNNCDLQTSASGSSLPGPSDLVLDPVTGDLYASIEGCQVIVRIAGDELTKVAGVTSQPSMIFPTSPYTPSDAKLTNLNTPTYLTLVGRDLYFIENNWKLVRRVDLDTGMIEAVIGNKNGPFMENAYGADTHLISSNGLAYHDGLLLISSELIYQYNISSGITQTYAGSGMATLSDGVPFKNKFGTTFASVHAVSSNEFYAVGQFSIFRVKNGIYESIIGHEYDKSYFSSGPGYSVYTVPAISDGPIDLTQMVSASCLFVTPEHDLYFFEKTSCMIKKISNGIVSTVAGNGTCEISGDGELATDAQLSSCGSLSVHATTQDVYYSESSKYTPNVGVTFYNRIRKISSSDGTITTVVGDGTSTTNIADVLNNVPATQAKFYFLSSFSLHGDDIYVTDVQFKLIRKVDGQTGNINTFAGTGYSGYTGSTIESALSANLTFPTSVKVSKNGDVFFGSANRVMVIGNDGLVRVIAGNGNSGTEITATNFVETEGLSTPMSFSGFSMSVVGSEVFLTESFSMGGFNSKTYSSIRWISPNFTCFGGYNCGNGFCQSQDVCSCDFGYSGNTCSVKNTCFGKDYDSPSVCGGRGSCLTSDSCSCGGGWIGHECDIATCFNKFANDTNSVCSGHGTCLLVNNCTCQTGYFGSECNITSCGGIQANDPNVCSGHGSCTALDTCACTGGYTGNTCSVAPTSFTCFGKLPSSQNVCSGRGTCTGTDSCSCNQHADSQISGQECETVKCKGTSGNYVPSSDATVCYGRGTCSETGCTCQTGYNGTYCQNTVCFNVDTSSPFICGGHGNCASPNSCTCQDDNVNGHYGGQDCTSCKNGFTGSSCLTKFCDAVATCHGHGTCNGNSECVCSNVFQGEFCDQCLSNYYGVNCSLFCEKTLTCSNHGVCAQDGSCTCDGSAVNGFWGGSSCNSCKVNFYGSDCKTGFEGPIQMKNFGDGLTMKIFGPSTYKPNSIPCNNLLNTTLILAIGNDAQCVWTDRENGLFEIRFGEKPTFTSGSVVSLNTKVFSNDSPSYITVSSVAAANPLKPVVVAKSTRKQVGSSEDVILDGSKSYSGDNNDLNYNWVVLQSASNTINTHVNNQIKDSKIVIPSSALSVGNYKIELTVTSQVTSMSSDPAYFEFEKKNSPLPIISFNGNSEIVSEKPITLKKKIDPPTDKPNQEVNIEWTQTQGPSTENEKDEHDNLVVTNYPSGTNTYKFKVKATDKSDSNIHVEDEVSFETKQKELELDMWVSFGNEGLSVKVERSDPDNENVNEVWSWQCEKVSDGSTCEAAVLNELNRAATSKEAPQFKPSLGITGERKLILTIQKGGRSISKTIVTSLAKVAPIVNEILPPTKQVRKGELVDIQLSTDKGTEREWKLDGMPILPSKTSKLGKDLSESDTLLLNTDELEEGTTYKVSMKSTDRESGKSTTFEHEFTVSLPPKACSCDVSKSSVIAMKDDISVSCTNCQNEKGSIKTEVGYKDEKTGIKIPMAKDEDEFSTKLPPTKSGDITVYTTIVDTETSSTREKEFKVTVTSPSINNVAQLETKISEWKSEETSGDYVKDVFKNTAIARVVSEITPTNEEEKQKLTNIKGELISDMANSHSIIEKDTFKDDYLTMQVIGLEDVLEKYETVSKDALETATNYYGNILDHALSSPTINIPKQLSESMVNVLDLLYKADDRKLTDKIYANLEKTSHVLVKTQHVGEYNVKVETSFATCVSNKDWQKDLPNKEIPFIGNFTIVLPEKMDTMVTQTSRKNPIAYTFTTLDPTNYTTPEQIVSPVVKLNIDSTLPEELSQPIAITLPLNRSFALKKDDVLTCQSFVNGQWEDDCTMERAYTSATCLCTKLGVVAVMRKTAVDPPYYIIGIVLGSVAAIVLIIGVILLLVGVACCMKKKKKTNNIEMRHK